MQMMVSQPIDLMLLDLGLPDVDGMEIIKKVREWSEIPIIVVSARDQDKEKALALDMGADDYLTKPFSPRPSCWPASGWRCGICTSRAAAKPKPCFRWVNFSWTRKSAGCFSGGGDPCHTDGVLPADPSVQKPGKVLTTAVIIREIWGPGYGNDTQALRALMAGCAASWKKIRPSRGIS